MKHLSRRELIRITVKDSALRFAYYDRKEDNELPTGEIEAAVLADEVTYDEIGEWFAAALKGQP